MKNFFANKKLHLNSISSATALTPTELLEQFEAALNGSDNTNNLKDPAFGSFRSREKRDGYHLIIAPYGETKWVKEIDINQNGIDVAFYDASNSFVPNNNDGL